MENKYTDYLRLKRDYNYDILRSICVNSTSKLIYFKPGKSAGTSIFRRNLQPKGGWIIQKDNPKEFNNWLQNITDKELNSYFKFIFVRNPFSRLISAWNDIDKPYFPDFGKFIQEGIFDKNGLIDDDAAKVITGELALNLQDDHSDTITQGVTKYQF